LRDLDISSDMVAPSSLAGTKTAVASDELHTTAKCQILNDAIDRHAQIDEVIGII
jgi:hypothetical protein